MLKCVKISLSTEYDAVCGFEDVVLVLLYMCKNWTAANRTVTELSIIFRSDRNANIPTSQWLLWMISAIDPDRMVSCAGAC